MKYELLRFVDIKKHVGDIDIIRGFDLCIFKKEILFLFGLSSAGIDEIIEILSGESTPDSGYIEIDSEPVSSSDLSISMKQRVFCVGENSVLVPEFTVAENLFIFKDQKRKRGIVKKHQIEKEVGKILSKAGLDIAPDVVCGTLDEFSRLLIEIVMCAQMGISLFVNNDFYLDYSVQEYKILNRTMEYYTKEGMSFLICMHNYNRICEQFSGAERFVVMRDGRKVSTLFSDDIEKKEIVALMTGRDVIKNYNRKFSGSKNVAFEVVKLSTEKYLNQVSFRLHEGEILGLLDLRGRGNRDLVTILSGNKHDYDGELLLGREGTVFKSQQNAIQKGVGYIIGGTYNNAALPGAMTVGENLSLLLMRKHGYGGVYDNSRHIEIVFEENREILRVGDIKADSSLDDIDLDSKLRLMYMRWIVTKPKLLLCVKPTWKLDFLMRNTVYQMLEKATQSGTGVIVFTPNPAEAATICDRVAVLSEGRIKGIISCEKFIKSDLIRILNTNIKI